MEAYRDQYATLFNAGRKVVVLGISVDADTTLSAWAREQGTPVLYLSDPDQSAGKSYGAATGSYHKRYLFVVGPDGRILHRMLPFNVLSTDAYKELAAAVAQGTGSATPGDGR
ncbi:MAG: putative peroxiredoxin [Gemmatimonadetes bacterium]|nr:putative peroxiredoxin [Gemmatimonadota bacterium]